MKAQSICNSETSIIPYRTSGMVAKDLAAIKHATTKLHPKAIDATDMPMSDFICTSRNPPAEKAHYRHAPEVAAAYT